MTLADQYPDTTNESGFIVFEVSQSEFTQRKYCETLKEAWDFSQTLIAELQPNESIPRNTVTITDIKLNDYYNTAKEQYANTAQN